MNNNNPIYHELQNRLTLLELDSNRLHTSAGTAAADEPRIKADLETTRKQLRELNSHANSMIRDYLRSELKKETSRLESALEVSTQQLAAFEKEVEKKHDEADIAGRNSINAIMQRADISTIEQILHDLSVQKEMLRVELTARPRVTKLGDQNAPAAVPESPD